MRLSDDRIETLGIDIETAVYHSCSVSWKNKMLIFGGSANEKRQIAEIKDCKITKVGELDFDLDFGTCTGKLHQLFIIDEISQFMQPTPELDTVTQSMSVSTTVTTTTQHVTSQFHLKTHLKKSQPQHTIITEAGLHHQVVIFFKMDRLALKIHLEFSKKIVS